MSNTSKDLIGSKVFEVELMMCMGHDRSLDTGLQLEVNTIIYCKAVFRAVFCLLGVSYGFAHKVGATNSCITERSRSQLGR